MSVPNNLPSLPALPSGGATPQAEAFRFGQGVVSNALVIQPNHPFFLRHHPSAWEVDDLDGKPALLPVLGQFILRPGVNGVRTRNQHEAEDETYNAAVFDETRKGWTFLDPNAEIDAKMLPKGAASGGYIRRLDCRQPGTGAPGSYFTEAWNVLQPGGEGVFVFDRPTFNAWRASLITSGLIRPPSESVVARLRNRYAGRLDRVEMLQVPEEVRQRRVKAAKSKSDATNAATVPA